MSSAGCANWRASTDPLWRLQLMATRLQRACRRRLCFRASDAAGALGACHSQQERAVRARPVAAHIATLEGLIQRNEHRASHVITYHLRKKSEVRRSQMQTKGNARMRIASARLRMERAAVAKLQAIHSEDLPRTIHRAARAAAVAKLEAIARMPITRVATAMVSLQIPPSERRLDRSAVGAVATINAECTWRDCHARRLQAAVRRMHARRRAELEIRSCVQSQIRDTLFVESEAVRAAGLLQHAWLSALVRCKDIEAQAEAQEAAQVVERLVLATLT